MIMMPSNPHQQFVPPQQPSWEQPSGLTHQQTLHPANIMLVGSPLDGSNGMYGDESPIMGGDGSPVMGGDGSPVMMGSGTLPPPPAGGDEQNWMNMSVQQQVKAVRPIHFSRTPNLCVGVPLPASAAAHDSTTAKASFAVPAGANKPRSCAHLPFVAFIFFVVIFARVPGNPSQEMLRHHQMMEHISAFPLGMHYGGVQQDALSMPGIPSPNSG